MQSVINQLHFQAPIDPALFSAALGSLGPQMREIDGFDAFHVIQTSPTDAIFVIVADSAETLDRIATEVGSPWMRENVVPLLSGPPERRLGPIVASTHYRWQADNEVPDEALRAG